MSYVSEISLNAYYVNAERLEGYAASGRLGERRFRVREETRFPAAPNPFPEGAQGPRAQEEAGKASARNLIATQTKRRPVAELADP